MTPPGENSRDSASQEDNKRAAVARAWVLHLSSGEDTEADRLAFAEWLAASDDNKRAYEKAYSIWEALGDVDGIENLLTHRDSVTEFRPRNSMTRRFLVGGAMAASLAVATGISFLLMQPAPTETLLYATVTGEIETITLSDGSRVTLGGASELTGEFTPDGRTLELVSGNAYFDIARDEARPLTVHTGDVNVRVLGTRFDIKTRPDFVAVAVDHGHVRVTSPATGSRQDLTAGEKIVSDAPHGLSEVMTFDAGQELSWRSGRLSFVDVPLRYIVADMNQYSDRPIRLSPTAPADLRLTLSFPVDQIEQVLAGLDAAYPVAIESREDDILITQDD